MRCLFVFFLLTLSIQAQKYQLFRSSNVGSNWSPVGKGLPETDRINALSFSGSSYFAATDRGIYLSTDQANSWLQTYSGSRTISLMAFGKTIFAGTPQEGLLRSLDSGRNWQPIAQSQFRYVRSLAVLDGSIYAGTDTQGVFVSADNGNTWYAHSSGLPALSQVFTMTVHRGSLYAGLYRKGLYKLDPQLKIWSKVGEVVPLALASTGEGLIAGHNPGGIHLLKEPNRNWTPAKLPYGPQLGNAPVWELAARPRLTLAGVAAYIYRSLDQGNTWTPLEQGIPAGATGIAFLINDNVALTAASIPLR